MGRKRYDKGGAKKKKAPREEDAALRLNHLIAASTILSEKSPSVAKFYAHASKQICRRVNITLDSVSVKRLFCKKCNGSLLPGVGDAPPTYRIASRRERHLVVRCGNCGFVKRYLARMPGHACRKGKKGKEAKSSEVNTSRTELGKLKSSEEMQCKPTDGTDVARDQETTSRFQRYSNNCRIV